MSDVFPKFIIETDEQEGNCLIVAKCTYHKQIVTHKDLVKGGGWWTRQSMEDTESNKPHIIFHGESHDFGKASLEDIRSCVKLKKVFSSPVLLNNISEAFYFFYKDEVGELTKLN